ncbi:unnamed protein product [Callosobruchus maculatus]|uniref:CCHC-type domain-containing protein n=1 Tax=Callosobruchus maculatus TaxID=64391 RepID=A0A653CTN8_CALMS|nr:unnamed protein product [Callosobruchus maculatus]
MDQRKAWILKLKIGKQVSKSMKVCSRHFNKGNAPESDELDETVKKLLSRTRDLEGLLKTCVNTKSEIKRAGADIYQLSLKISRLNKNRIRQPVTLINTKTQTQDVATQTEIEAKNTNETSTQTLGNDDIDRERQKKAIREKINGGTTLDDLKGLLDLEWPRTVFERLHEIPGDALASSWEYDLVNFTTSDFEKAVSRRYRERYGGLAELKAQTEEIGGVAYLMNSLTVPTATGNVRKDRYIWHLVTEKAPLELTSIEDLYKAACRLRELLKENGRHKLAIPFISTYNWSHVEKTFEYVFKDTEVEICVHKYEKARSRHQKTPSADSSNTKSVETKRAKRPTREAVIVSSRGKSYADLVRGLREQVDVKGLDVELSRIRKTNKGDVLLEVKKGNVETLQSAINTQWQEARAIKKYKQTVLHLRDLDSLTTIDEIMDTLRELFGEEAKRCKVASLRPAQGESQNATIIADNDLAQLLLKKGSLLVGSVHCQIKQRQESEWYNRCWAKGHVSRSCKGPDRTSLCYKCAKPGHVARDCSNELFCVLCNKEGHRSGKTGCECYQTR